MSEIIRFEDHARASSRATGRATCSGQPRSSGHLSENHKITSSYFRAVKVLASSSKRSKKRQSPAASRPIVDKLTSREAAYADAQAMRFERSSVSMTSKNSRKIPTNQAVSIGSFRLAQTVEKSDKSAMAAVDDIRRTIRLALASADESAMVVAKDLGLDREYIRDFLKGRKRSLNLKASVGLSERYGIPLAHLTPTKEIPTIRKGARPHLYIAEHMEARGLDDQQMANRIEGIPVETITKWRADPSKLQEWQVSAVLHALDLDEVAALAKLPLPARPPQRRPAARKRA